MSLARSSITDSLVIGVVSFAQSIALAKTFAIKNGYKIEANQVAVCVCLLLPWSDETVLYCKPEGVSILY